MSSSIVSPFPFFTDTTGAPLEGGYIYLGQSNLNPETAPVNVFWDSALTIPAGQPIRTVGGYPSRAGTASRLYVSADTYSITVRNKNRALVFSAFDQSDAPTSVFDISTQLITAVASQVTFTLTTFTYLPGTDTLEVYRNGLRLNLNLDYLESNSSTVTLTSPAAAGDQFLFQGGSVVTSNATPGSSVSFIQSGTGAVTRNIQDKARESVSVKDFGAVGNGVTDDTAAIQAAIDSSRNVFLPAGIYKTTAPLTISNSNQVVYGAGWSTQIALNKATDPVVLLVGALEGVQVKNLFLNRTIAPTNDTAVGIQTPKTVGLVTTYLRDLLIKNQWHGAWLGPAAYGKFTFCVVQENYQDGIYCSNYTGYNASQWDIESSLSQANNRYGLSLNPYEGTTLIPNEWVNFTTYANTQGGIYVDGSPTRLVYDIRGSAITLSSDGNTALNLQNMAGSTIVLNNLFIELVGLVTTGRGLLTPISNTGSGIILGGSVSNANFADTIVSACSEHGVIAGAAASSFVNCQIIDNSKKTNLAYVGIFISNNVKCKIIGCKIGNSNPAKIPQASSVVATNGSFANIIGNDFTNQGGTVAVQKGAGVTINEYGNIAYITQNAGKVFIPVGSNFVLVTHGLNGTPIDYSILVTPFTSPTAGGVSSFWVDTVTSTTFKINVNTNVTTQDVYFNWSANL